MSIILFAAGSSLIVDFEECCSRNNIEIKAIVNNYQQGPCFATEVGKLITISELTNQAKAFPFIVPLFAPNNRFLACQEALSFGLLPYTLLSFPNNALSQNLKSGKGCFINAGVTIGGSCHFGDFVLINRGACVGHHVILDDFVSIGPGTTICGNVHINKGAAIGGGVTILPNIKIGKHAKIGAGSVVTKHIDEGQVVVGNPARFLKMVPTFEIFS